MPVEAGCSARNGEMKQQLLGAVDAGFAAGLAFVFAGVWLDAVGFRSAADAKARIVEAAVGATDRLGHAVERDVLVKLHGVQLPL